MTLRPRTLRAGAIVIAGLFIAGACAVASADPARAGADPDRRFRLREIRVHGLPELSASERRALTGLDEGARYTGDQLLAVRDTITARLARLAAFPLARLDTVAVDTLAGGRTVNISARIVPGPRPIVASLEITGPGAQHAGELSDAIETSPGDPFRVNVWRADLERVVDWLRARGYPFARASSERIEPRFAGDTVLVELALAVQPGARVHIERVEFAGLTHTRPRTAERTARIRAGVFNPKEIARARRRLLRSEWCRTVAPGEIFRDREGRYGVLFTVEEQRTNSVTGAVGYDPVELGLAGTFDATLANLFGGGRSFDLHWRRDGDRARRFSLAYREPFLFGAPLDARIHLDQEVRDSLYVAVEFGAGLAFRAADDWLLTATIRRRSIEADSLAADTTDFTLIGLGARVEYDSRDRATNPRAGALVRIGSERLFVSGTETVIEPGGSASARELPDLYRHTFAAETAVPLRGDWVGYGALHGVELRADDDRLPPVAEWVQLGGIESVRGFAERSLLAPRAGWGTIELRRLLGPLSRAYALADVAALDTGGSARWEWAYGAGVQVDTGVGLFNVAVAVPGGEGLSAAVMHAQAIARF
ncbi:MAG: Outer membrane protein assembly factor BamA [Calditrichaeota bacterium]|nr:Outer membrane protein assembly factor BamA [Calditrichota bacterium]